MSKHGLDDLIDDAADEHASLKKFSSVDCAALSDSDFGRHKSAVFRQVKAADRQRRLAGEVRDLDAEAQRRGAE